MTNTRILRLPVFPAILYLSACAGTGPAPVIDLNAPATRTLQSQVTPRTATVEPSAGDGVVVSALAEPATLTAAHSQQAEVRPAGTRSAANGRSQNFNPAVVGLLNRANRDQQNGDLVRATASIERALKIAPDNAWLWHRLAQLRLEQGQAGQAAALAAKSNSLINVQEGVGSGTGNRQLMAKNWLLIAKVHTQRGESVAARAATARARRIQSGAG